METQLPMSFTQNIFATCSFHIAQQQPALLSFFEFFLVYLKLLSPVHFHIKNYSYIIYLEFAVTFKTHRQLTLIDFTLYCNSYVKVNRK